ncbi:MAG: histidine--tRNA ligase [Bacteroidales bacterium]|nr:histidine--tRNA ligase [Bacteroidales bacterium]
MASQKASIPKGTRDFSPGEMSRRNFIFNAIREVFNTHGFLQIETPAMENLSTLLGKYGEEGDKLLFRILNSGNFLRGLFLSDLSEREISKVTSHISKRGLRYDLTVPFARYVVQHRNEINFPFRRYQIQPVWRADNPQKGRYREFYQCDADIIGSNSLLNESELIGMIVEVFDKLSLSVSIKLNNRKILAGIAEVIGETERIADITVAIDKLDKIGAEKVRQELVERGVSEQSVNLLDPVFAMRGNNTEKLNFLGSFLSASKIGMEGVEEIKSIFEYVSLEKIRSKVELDITLARGLDYYTGAIIEVKSEDVEIGSICGGGRYDDLTGVFGLPGVSGVGISFGADRIYDVLANLDLFPASTNISTQVLFVNFGDAEVRFIIPLLRQLREAGIRSELYPEVARMKKQMNYANSLNIPYVVIAGENEIRENKVSLKNMVTGEQEQLSPDELLALLTD